MWTAYSPADLADLRRQKTVWVNESAKADNAEKAENAKSYAKKLFAWKIYLWQAKWLSSIWKKCHGWHKFKVLFDTTLHQLFGDYKPFNYLCTAKTGAKYT